MHLPAVNTPQFDWAHNKFRHKLAPVPPIYQPETIAAAVLRAAREHPREYWVGMSAVKAIVAQTVAPSVADRYLARGGKRSETTGEPAESSRPDNLFQAGIGDPGAHGRFDGRARGHAVPFNPGWLRFGAAATIAGLVGWSVLRRRSPGRAKSSRRLGRGPASDVSAR